MRQNKDRCSTLSHLLCVLVQKAQSTQLGDKNVVMTSNAHYLEANLGFHHVAQVEDIRVASREGRPARHVGMGWWGDKEWEGNSHRFLCIAGQGTLPIVHIVLHCMNFCAKKRSEDVEGVDYKAEILCFLPLSLLRGCQDAIAERQREALSSIASWGPCAELASMGRKMHLERVIDGTDTTNCSSVEMLGAQSSQGD